MTLCQKGRRLRVLTVQAKAVLDEATRLLGDDNYDVGCKRRWHRDVARRFEQHAAACSGCSR